MFDASTNLKKERINETNTAANVNATVRPMNPNTEEDKTSDTNKTESNSDENHTIRMVSYPIIIGGVGLIGGVFLASKLSKNKILFSSIGFVVGSSIGYLLYQNWKKRN